LEQQPEWFNDHAMSIIPEDFIDDLKILARIRTRNVQDMIQELRESFIGGALIPTPGSTPKREDLEGGSNTIAQPFYFKTCLPSLDMQLTCFIPPP